MRLLTLSLSIYLLLIISSCRTAKGHQYPADAPIQQLDSNSGALNVIVMGDWGQQGSSGQRLVANRMAAAAQQINAAFIITTGDNLYPNGVADTSDIQWKLSYENVYTAASLQIPWLVVLGNHDYQTNPDAEVAYTAHSNRWHLPSRYYDTTIAIGKDSALFVFIDTEPLEQFLRKKAAVPFKFPPGGAMQQLQWLDQRLATSHAKWKIVTGHHPLHTGGSRRHSSRTKKMRRLLQPVFQRHQVDIYFAGHEHQLEYLKVKKLPTHHIISGAASETRHVGFLKFHRRFTARQMGFVTLSVKSELLQIQFVGADSKRLYSFIVQK